MKRFYLIYLILAATIPALAQDTLVCQPDTGFINSGAIVVPTPIQNDTLGDGLPDACINTPYDLTIFVHPPSTIAAGPINVPVTSFRIDSVINLPEGLDFQCSTDDCTFLADSINCIYLSGTPTESNTDTIYELTIHLTVAAGGLSFVATFPDPGLAPGSYHINLNPEGDAACQSTPTVDFHAVAETVNVYPNPARDQLTLAFDSKSNTDGVLQVWSHAGQLLKQQQIRITRGYEQLLVPLQDIPPGFYIVGIQTSDASFRSKFIKN